MLTNNQRRYTLSLVQARIRVLEGNAAHQQGPDQAPWLRATEDELRAARAVQTALRATSHPPGAVEAVYWLHPTGDGPPGAMRDWEVRRAFPDQPVEVLCGLMAAYDEGVEACRWLAHELLAAASQDSGGDVVERVGHGIPWLRAGEDTAGVWLCWHVQWSGGAEGEVVDLARAEATPETAV